jgi:dienelactone hydrolase
MCSLAFSAACSSTDDDPNSGYSNDASFVLPGNQDSGSSPVGSALDAGSSVGSGDAALPDSGLPGLDSSVPALDAGSDAGHTGIDAAPGDAGPSDGGGDATADSGTDAALAMPADYTKRGRYTVKRLLNQGLGTISGGDSALLPRSDNNDPSGFTLYFPENAAAGERFPLLTFGNGTFCSPTFYDELITHVASHGFVVVAANTSTVGTGEPMLKAVDWALAQNGQTGSPINGKIDGEHIGAFGHSQGGAGTCNAGLDARIDAIVPLSGVPLNEDAGTGTVSMIKVPVFFTTTADEASGSTLIEDSFNAAKAPAAYGVTSSGNHDEYTDVVDDPGVPGLTSDDARQSRAAVAAWFDWHLKGKAEVRPLFVGASCGFCSGSTWLTFKSKGL